MIFLLILLVIIILTYTVPAIKVFKEYKRGVVFRLGRLIGVKGPGLFWIFPKIDQVVKVDLRTISYDARTIKIITKDNVRCDLDSFVYYRVIDLKKAVMEVRDYITISGPIPSSPASSSFSYSAACFFAMTITGFGNNKGREDKTFPP